MWNRPMMGQGQPNFKEISPAQAKAMLDNGQAVLIDVREPNEYAEVRANGAQLIPLGTLPQRLNELPTDQDVLMICRSGSRSAMACQLAGQAGYSRLYNVAGGTLAWQAANLPVERG